MQIKRLLDDRDVHAGDRLFDAQGRHVRYLVHGASEILCGKMELNCSSMIYLSARLDRCLFLCSLARCRICN